MIAFLVSETFARIGHVWNIGGRLQEPTEDDIAKVLDEAAGVLYTSSVGTQWQSGGLVVEKTTTGFDVYVYVGNYK